MPEVSTVHIDTALTNVSVAYRNTSFVSDLLAPPVPVRKQSDRYFVYDAERERFRESVDVRAPGAEAREVDFKLSSENYFCDDHALAGVIPDEERENADPPLSPAIDRVEFLTDKIALNKEIELATLIADDSDIPGTTLSGTTRWSDYTNSDPLTAVEAGRAAVLAAVQEVPNVLVLPYDVYAKVRLHPKVRELAAAADLGMPGPETLARIFDVERVLVPRAYRNVAKPGQPPSMQFVWGKHALLAVVPRRPGLKMLGLACTFQWTAAPGALDGRVVEVWREPRRKADMIRVQRYYDQRLVAPMAAYRWKTAVA